MIRPASCWSVERAQAPRFGGGEMRRVERRAGKSDHRAQQPHLTTVPAARHQAHGGAGHHERDGRRTRGVCAQRRPRRPRLLPLPRLVRRRRLKPARPSRPHQFPTVRRHPSMADPRTTRPACWARPRSTSPMSTPRLELPADDLDLVVPGAARRRRRAGARSSSARAMAVPATMPTVPGNYR